MADDARLAELRGLMAEALRANGTYLAGPETTRKRVDALLPVVEQHAARRAADALMWSAWTVAHSPGIKHQANAVNEIRARATALTPATEEKR